MIPNRHLTERTHITGANQPAAKISLLHRFCLGLPTHILPNSQPFVSLKVQKSYNNCGNLNHNQDIFKVAQILQRSGWHSLGIRLKFGFKLQAVIMWTNNCKKSLFDPFLLFLRGKLGRSPPALEDTSIPMIRFSSETKIPEKYYSDQNGLQLGIFPIQVRWKLVLTQTISTDTILWSSSKSYTCQRS